MAESMKGLKRSHRCTEVSNALIGNEVTVMGWVQKSRNKGGIIFVDLRDRSGILQVIFEEANVGSEKYAKAEKLRSEFVVAITGKVAKRAGAVNENIATGDIEVIASDIRILSEADTPPFPIEENSKTKEELRLKYRYLDLRRPDLQKNIMLRSKVATLTRAFLADEGFLEIETPTLCKSTPEGARDYLVPSRVHPGTFYALPQSPQIYKQLLMCSGYDRYFQIARCYRDEDLRADRQPEFTQIDMELSFVDVDDVIDVNERLLAKLFKETIGVEVSLPIQRMTYKEAMERFGSDKPDLRFGMELKDVTDVVRNSEFVVFKGAIDNGGSVRGINAKGQGAMPRKKIDALVDFAKGYGAKGLAYIAIQEDGSYKSSFAKFMTDDEMNNIVSAMEGENGDLLLFAADLWAIYGYIDVRKLIPGCFYIVSIQKHTAPLLSLQRTDPRRVQKIQRFIWNCRNIRMQLILDDEITEIFIIPDIRCNRDLIQTIGHVDQILHRNRLDALSLTVELLEQRAIHGLLMLREIA